MNGIRQTVFAIVLMLLALRQAPLNAADFDYPLERVTDKIQVIVGPLELPDSANRGFRNNVVIVHTSKGIVLMDPGGSAWAGEMVAARIRSMTAAPVVAVFNSHVHGDHWLGNEGIRRHFPAARIYGHARMKTRLEQGEGGTWLQTINRLTDDLADGRRLVSPDHVVGDGDVISVGDTDFRVIHTGKAHTDCDIMVEIVGEDALFTGDVVRDRFLGLMEDDSSFRGNIEAIDNILARNFSHYIPGHGKVGGAELPRSYRSYLKTLRDKVEQLFEDDLADYEMKPLVVEAMQAYRDWNGFDLRLGAHISRAYLEIERERF